MHQILSYIWKFFLIICSCRAAIIRNATNPFRYAGFERCVDKETGRELYVGEAFYRIGQCIRVQCLGDLTLWEDKCNTLNVEGDCIQIESNRTLPYPRCCPLYECQKILNNGTFKELRVYDHYVATDPIWNLERRPSSGFLVWTRDKSKVHFRCEVEVLEYETNPDEHKIHPDPPHIISSLAVVCATCLTAVVVTMVLPWYLIGSG